MTRPKNPRKLTCKPCCTCFTPKGASQGEEVLLPDELEALKLREVDGLKQTAAATEMKVSQPTFARILKSAHQKLARAMVEGKVINLK